MIVEHCLAGQRHGLQRGICFFRHRESRGQGGGIAVRPYQNLIGSQIIVKSVFIFKPVLQFLRVEGHGDCFGFSGCQFYFVEAFQPFYRSVFRCSVGGRHIHFHYFLPVSGADIAHVHAHLNLVVGGSGSFVDLEVAVLKIGVA